MTSIQIKNPSPFTPLRIFSQDRLRNVFVDAPKPAAVKRSTRAELEGKGRAITMKPTRVTTRFSSEMRDCPVPLYRSLGYSSVEEYCTTIMDKELIASQQAITPAPSVQRVRDEWKASPQALMLVPPGETRVIKDGFEENKRLVIECPEDEAALQIQNESQTRTLRLLNRDPKTGECTAVAFLAPAQVGLVIANKKSAAVVELLPS